MQADPIIQAPNDSQSYNRYAYVRNNPLSLTDPSGYSWLSKTWKKIKSFVGLIVAVVGGIICGPQCSMAGVAMIGAASGAAGAAANGGNIVTGALKGAFTAAAFYGVGSAFSEANCASCFSGGELTAAATVGKIAAHAMVGGVSSVLQGGKFGHGFFAAGVTQGFAKSINSISSARFSVGRIAAAAVIGGTISKITGGKFANGATTGAFSRMFNDEAHFQSNRSEFNKKYGAITKAGNIDIDKNMADAASISTDEWIDRVRSGGDWDYKNDPVLKGVFSSSLLDEFGNVHFGMVANAHRFNLESSLYGAGVYQVNVQGGGNSMELKAASGYMAWSLGGTLMPDNFTRSITNGGFGWGDNVGDSINIMNGWDYAENGM